MYASHTKIKKSRVLTHNASRREKEEQYTSNQYNMISCLLAVCVPFLISLDPPLSEHRQHVIPNVIGV